MDEWEDVIQHLKVARKNIVDAVCLRYKGNNCQGCPVKRVQGINSLRSCRLLDASVDIGVILQRLQNGHDYTQAGVTLHFQGVAAAMSVDKQEKPNG